MIAAKDEALGANRELPDRERDNSTRIPAALSILDRNSQDSTDETYDETAADICATGPMEPPWLVPGFIVEASITELDGKVKLGKTSIALDMARALLEGGTFLGAPCKRTAIVYITEQGKPSFTEALHRAGLEQATALYPIFWLEHRGLSWPALVQFAVKKCQRVGAKLLITDTISKLAGVRQENEAGELAAAIEPLQVKATGNGIAVLAPRHDRKSGGDVGDSGRGSSQMTGDADIVVQLTRPEGNHPRTRRVLNRVSRFDDEVSILIERQDDNTFLALGSPESYAGELTRKNILNWLPDTGEVVPGPVLAGYLNGKDDQGKPKTRFSGTQSRELKKLIDEGKVVRSGKGSRGEPFEYRKVVDVQLVRTDEVFTLPPTFPSSSRTNGAGPPRVDAHGVPVCDTHGPDWVSWLPDGSVICDGRYGGCGKVLRRASGAAVSA